MTYLSYIVPKWIIGYIIFQQKPIYYEAINGNISNFIIQCPTATVCIKIQKLPAQNYLVHRDPSLKHKIHMLIMPALELRVCEHAASHNSVSVCALLNWENYWMPQKTTPDENAFKNEIRCLSNYSLCCDKSAHMEQF